MWACEGGGGAGGGCYSVILEDFTQDTVGADLTVTEWCQRAASSDRIHLPAHHSPAEASTLLAIRVQKGKFGVVLLSAYLKDELNPPRYRLIIQMLWDYTEEVPAGVPDEKG